MRTTSFGSVKIAGALIGVALRFLPSGSTIYRGDCHLNNGIRTFPTNRMRRSPTRPTGRNNVDGFSTILVMEHLWKCLLDLLNSVGAYPDRRPYSRERTADMKMLAVRRSQIMLPNSDDDQLRETISRDISDCNFHPPLSQVGRVQLSSPDAKRQNYERGSLHEQKRAEYEWYRQPCVRGRTEQYQPNDEIEGAANEQSELHHPQIRR